MYLARYEFNNQDIVQARIGIPSRAISASTFWQPLIGPLVEGRLILQGQWISLRLILEEGRPKKSISAGCVLNGGDADEKSLVRWASAFTRIERITGEPIDLPTTREDYDRICNSLPNQACRITCDGFQRSGLWFACDYSLFPVLSDLISAAISSGHRLAWQVDLAPIEPTLEQYRSALINVSRIRNLSGSFQELAVRQEELAQQLMLAKYLSNETLMVDESSVGWTRSWLAADFDKRYKRFRFSRPSFEFIGTKSDEMDTGLHLRYLESTIGGTPIQVDELCGSAQSIAHAVELVNWSPSKALTKMLEIDDMEGGDDDRSGPPDCPPPGQPGGPPDPYVGTEPYVFISYSHADLGRIIPIMWELRRACVNVWWDRGIPGGVEWDEFLERKIASCSALVLMLSQRSVDSKYVRREVKYADRINKMVMSIRLESSQFKAGLDMLLCGHQMVDANQPDLRDRLKDSLRYCMGA